MIRNMIMMSAATVALLAGGSVAQETATTPGTGPDAGIVEPDPALNIPRFRSIDEMNVGDVVGMVAYDPEGGRIGEIDYVLMQPDKGLVAVIGIGGFLGLGEYTVALPMEDFKLDENGLSFVLDTDKETLKAQPEFDETGVQGLPRETMIAELMYDEFEPTDVKPTQGEPD